MPLDPWRNFKFEVEINGFVRAGFQKASGLKQTTEVIEYREGGENETPRKLPGQTSFDPIVLERGKSADDAGDFLSWAKEIFNLDAKDGAQGDSNDFRRQIVIYLKDKGGNRVVKWTCLRCWPSEYSSGDLDAQANDVDVETLTLQNEGIKEERL
jgi:phage tail-like protein